MKNTLSVPTCSRARHSWKNHGGLSENPGFYGIGGAAAEMGRKGGAARSEDKTLAARANGKKGGRPNPWTLEADGPQAHTPRGAWIAIVPQEVADDQGAHDGMTFPILLIRPFGWPQEPVRRARGKLRGDLYGLGRSGSGDMMVAIVG